MLSRLDTIGKYVRISKLLPVRRNQANYTVENVGLLSGKPSNGNSDNIEDNEDMDVKHDRCMLTKDDKIDTVDLDGKKIEPININPWYEEDELDRARDAALNKAKNTISTGESQ